MGQITVTAADGHTFSAYTAGSANAAAAVVVLPEIFGVNQHMRARADAFAAAGYAVICPALFDRGEKGFEVGYGPEDRQKGFALYGKVTPDMAVMDVDAAAKTLGSKKLGIVGYCWGGAITWLSATRTKDFAAASAWYGGGIAATKDEKPNCPVQMHFGEADGAIPMTDVDAIKAAQPNADIYVYPNAGHGFGCDERDSFNKEAFELAQQRTLAFFKKYLG